MADEQPNKEEEVTQKGAVEVNEEGLDQAAGGVLIGLNQPAAKPEESLSINYNKIEVAGQKVSPTLATGAGAIPGPHVSPEKKI
jgi:hypothetical protein